MTYETIDTQLAIVETVYLVICDAIDVKISFGSIQIEMMKMHE